MGLPHLHTRVLVVIPSSHIWNRTGASSTSVYFLSTIVAKKDFGGAIQIQIPERNHAEHDLTTCDQTFCLAMSDFTEPEMMSFSSPSFVKKYTSCSACSRPLDEWGRRVLFTHAYHRDKLLHHLSPLRGSQSIKTVYLNLKQCSLQLMLVCPW